MNPRIFLICGILLISCGGGVWRVLLRYLGSITQVIDHPK